MCTHCSSVDCSSLHRASAIAAPSIGGAQTTQVLAKVGVVDALLPPVGRRDASFSICLHTAEHPYDPDVEWEVRGAGAWEPPPPTA